MKLLVKLTLLAAVFTAIFYIHGDSLFPTLYSEPESSTRQASNFDTVVASGATNVSVSIGEEYRVEVIARERLLRHVETTVNNNTLTITRRGSSWLFPLARRGSVQVNVTLPEVRRLQSSGASTLRMQSELRQPALELQSSGASDLHVSAQIEELQARASGSSDIRISGHAAHADIHASGSSDFRGRNFSADTVEIQLSGSSSARLEVRERISGRLSGSSSLHLTGNPEVDVSTSGSSNINQRSAPP